MKETLKQAGYKYFAKKCEGLHILINSDGKAELWGVNKNHSGYGLKYKNTHLEFVSGTKLG